MKIIDSINLGKALIKKFGVMSIELNLFDNQDE